MRILIAAGTDIGRQRVNNEDSYACCQVLETQTWSVFSDYTSLGEWGGLSIVADGMGGPESGEVASSIALSAIQKFFSPERLAHVSNKESFLAESVHNANEAILDYVKSHPDAIGMGTTVVLLWVIGGFAYIAWVGDSRCYVFSPRTGLCLLTKDHSYVQELIDKGEIRPKDAMNHPDSNIITRGLGDIDVSSEADVIVYPVEEGDIFLLCSDGLSGYVSDNVINRIICKNLQDMNTCCTALIQCALNAGGEDNITVALAATLPDDSFERRLGLKNRIRGMFQ